MPIEEQSIKNRDDITIQDLRVNDLIALDGKNYIVVAPYFGNCVHVMGDATLERREFYASEPFKWIAYLGKTIIREGKWETRDGQTVSVVRNHYEHRAAFPFMYALNDGSGKIVFLAHIYHGSKPAFDLVAPHMDILSDSDEVREFEVGQVWKTRSGQEATIRRVLRNGNLECFRQDEKRPWDANWLGMSTRSQDDLVEYLRESEIRYLQIGKRYRNTDGKIVTIVSENPYKDNEGVEYGEFGFSRALDPSIVALAEDEPAKQRQKEEKKGTAPATEAKKSKKNRDIGTPIHYSELQPGDLVRVKYDDKIWIEAYVDVTGEDGANYINRDTDLNISDCEDEVRLLQRGALPKLRVGQQWKRVDGEVVVVNKVNAAGHFLTERGDCYTTIFDTYIEGKDLETCLNQNTLHSDESHEVVKLNDSIILFYKNTQQEIIAPVGSKGILQALSNFASAVCGEPTIIAPLSSVKIIEK